MESILLLSTQAAASDPKDDPLFPLGSCLADPQTLNP